MSVVSKLLRALRASPLSLTYALLMCGRYGAGALQRSTLRMKLNREEYQGAADEFPKWRMAGGRILAGLVRQKAAEKHYF